MKKLLGVSVALFVLVAAAAYAERDRPHEGKITRVDQDARMITVQGEKGDQWDLYWNESTKLKNNLVVTTLNVGDSVHFDFKEQDGKKWLTELHRTHRAKD